MKIAIDRSKAFNVEPHLLSNVTITYENPKSLDLLEIDSDRIQLQKVFDRREMNNEEFATFNTFIRGRLATLDSKYILLDAAVVTALLGQPDLIPKEWASITDADASTEESGSIGFYGTQFLRSDENVPMILKPFFNRGHWEGDGHGAVYISDDTLEYIHQGKFGNLLEYAAVYPLQ